MESLPNRESSLIKWIRPRLYLMYVPLLGLFMLNTVLQRVNNYPRNHILWSDTEGYYMYLPAIFIIKDVHQVPAGSVLPQPNEKGEHVIKYTCGVAMMELPFFIAAKWYCQLKGCDRKDYFSLHYVRAIAIGGFLYGMIGLVFLAAALRRKFSEAATFWTILSVFLGTNLFYYTMRSPAMSHVYSFFLFAFTIWYLPRFYKRQTVWHYLLLGFVTGLTVLIRPTNAVLLLFIFLYEVYTKTDLRERFSLMLQAWGKVIVAGLAAFVVFIPQLWYWYEMTGSVLRYSYVNESFKYWLQPKIAAVLFDVQNGLFLYSPMALLMVVGIILGIRRKDYQGPTLGIIFIIVTYLFASWWAWWFGGAFGHRCYVEFYALFAIPLAGLYQQILDQRSILLKIVMFLVTAFLMFYGVKMSMLHSYLPGPWDGADWRWNWEKIEWVWSYLFRPMK